ncbi:MAG: hypothetical protein QOF51_2720 [Chloroflexota bacterium]|jgi:hypothetical protein|nr:hypothetical protein [Chloroflexota bacterium]
MTIPTLFQLIALILFAIAAFGVAFGRGNLIAGGLFFWLLADMWGTLSGLR